MTIDGPLWFGFAVLICGGYALHIRSWRRERRVRDAWWKSYDERSQKRHDEMMRALDCREAAWTTDEYEGEP